MTLKPDSTEKSKEKISEDAYKELLTNELDQQGLGGIFVWGLFALCVLPNILNGFHVSSYTLLGHLPDDQWCEVTDLQKTNWTIEQQRNITDPKTNNKDKGCNILHWDYNYLSTLSYDQALINISQELQLHGEPQSIKCKSKGSYQFPAPESTFVSEWELVCERSLDRTSAQVVISLGKFCGSFSFGIFADKYGRKASFTLGAVFFVVSSFICTFSPWYNLFLVGRFGLGSASSGLFYPAFTMLVENICLKYRSWMSICFSASYPVGMILLAVASYLIDPWRYLQFALTVPSLLLILNCFLMKESPRWLITNKKYDRVYQDLFKRKSHFEVDNTVAEVNSPDKKIIAEKDVSLCNRIREGPLKQIIELFATWKMCRLILTSYFMFCVTSLSYYVTALNAANMSVSRYLYVAITGLVDLPSYLVPVIMLRYCGRRVTTMSMFWLTSLGLLLVLVVPMDQPVLIFVFAMIGRFGISATYSVVTLYTAELYPTEIRNSALGTCSTWAHVGSISAPYVVDVLGKLGWYIPTTICGCCVLVAGLLTLTLPETATGKLSDRIEEVPSDEKDTQPKVKVVDNEKQ